MTCLSVSDLHHSTIIIRCSLIHICFSLLTIHVYKIWGKEIGLRLAVFRRSVCLVKIEEVLCIFYDTDLTVDCHDSFVLTLVCCFLKNVTVAGCSYTACFNASKRQLHGCLLVTLDQAPTAFSIACQEQMIRRSPVLLWCLCHELCVIFKVYWACTHASVHTNCTITRGSLMNSSKTSVSL